MALDLDVILLQLSLLLWSLGSSYISSNPFSPLRCKFDREVEEVNQAVVAHFHYELRIGLLMTRK